MKDLCPGLWAIGNVIKIKANCLTARSQTAPE